MMFTADSLDRQSVRLLFAQRFVPPATVAYDVLRFAIIPLSPLSVFSSTSTYVLAAGFAVVYLAIARAMWLTGRPFFLVRTAVALLDAIVLTTSADGIRDVTINPGIMLAVDLALRCGAVAFVFPAAYAVIAAIADGPQGDLLAAGVPSIGLAAVIGLTVGWYFDRRQATQDRSYLRERQAQESLAELAAANAIVMRSERTADLLQRCSVLVALADPEVGVQLSDTGKAGLAVRTRQSAAYFGDVLTRWESDRRRDADLTRNLRVEAAPDVATALLTPEQAATFAASLTEFEVAGRVTVSAVGDLGRLDRDRVIEVAGRRVLIPLDPFRVSSFFSPVPAMAVMVGLWMVAPLFMADTNAVAIPVGLALLTFAVAGAAHVAIGRDESRLTAAMWTILGLAVVYCVLMSSRGIARPSLGVVEVPAAGVIEMSLYAVAMTWTHLEPARRVAAIAAIVTMIIVSARLVSGSDGWGHFAAEMGGVVIAAPVVVVAAIRLEELRRERHAHLKRLAASSTVAAAAHARVAWLDRLRNVHGELTQARHAARLPSDMRHELDRRLAAAAADLDQIEAELANTPSAT